MSGTEPVIIEAAINGVASKERNPNVPRKAGEIAACALASIAAGAAIVHNHVDDPTLTSQAAAEELVREVAALAREVGRPLATIDRTAKILGMPEPS